MLSKTPPPIPVDAFGPRWEYKVLTHDLQVVVHVERLLTGLGEQGWELLSMVPDSGKAVLVFKRRKRPSGSGAQR